MATKESDGVSYEHQITVQPPYNEATSYDRAQAVFVKIDSSMVETYTTGPEDGSTVISELLDMTTGNITADQVEEFAWVVSDGMMFAFKSYTPNRPSGRQRPLDAYVGADEDTSLPQPLKETYETLVSTLPESVEIRIGTLPMDIFGSSPALGTRLVMTQENKKPAGREKVSHADANALFQALAEEPFLLHAIFRTSTNLPETYEYQVTVRIFLFNPAYRLSSAAEYNTCLWEGRQCDPGDSFADLGVASSISVIDDQYTPSMSINDVSREPRSHTLHDFEHDKALITGQEEFNNMRRGQYGASDTLEDLCSYTSLLSREIDLEHFVGLSSVDPTGDPWAAVPGARGLDIDDIGIEPESIIPEPVTIAADGPIKDTPIDQERTTANDGTKAHWQHIKKTAVAFENEGYDVVIVTQDTGSRPDLWVRRDDGEIFAVEVEYRTKSKVGSFYTNVIRQALWGYKTITVMVPKTGDDDDSTASLPTLGRWALNALAVPMDKRAPKRTRLDNTTNTITVDGATMLLPEGVSEAEWWLTCRDEYLLIHDGEVLARGAGSEPFVDFTFNVPRYYQEDGRYIVADQHGTQLAAYDTQQEINRTTLRTCHRPVDLSYLHFVESIYCFNRETEELVLQNMTAEWDANKPSVRNEKSHRQAFERFLVEAEPDDPLLESEVRSFITDWIERQSSDAHPGNAKFGEYRNEYSLQRSQISTQRGMEWVYEDTSFRYSRGLVSPDLPGLETKPSFPDDWGIDDKDVLQTPLIHGLDHRAEVTSSEMTDP
jgi:hypothetical protein